MPLEARFDAALAATPVFRKLDSSLAPKLVVKSDRPLSNTEKKDDAVLLLLCGGCGGRAGLSVGDGVLDPVD